MVDVFRKKAEKLWLEWRGNADSFVDLVEQAMREGANMVAANEVKPEPVKARTAGEIAAEQVVTVDSMGILFGSMSSGCHVETPHLYAQDAGVRVMRDVVRHLIDRHRAEARAAALEEAAKVPDVFVGNGQGRCDVCCNAIASEILRLKEKQ